MKQTNQNESDPNKCILRIFFLNFLFYFNFILKNRIKKY